MERYFRGQQLKLSEDAASSAFFPLVTVIKNSADNIWPHGAQVVQKQFSWVGMDTFQIPISFTGAMYVAVNRSSGRFISVSPTTAETSIQPFIIQKIALEKYHVRGCFPRRTFHRTASQFLNLFSLFRWKSEWTFFRDKHYFSSSRFMNFYVCFVVFVSAVLRTQFLWGLKMGYK